ncbi:unnamed protein product [Parnassius apollo]|uniref:(apollo) hypothetical protein n=1 Tax=Parnassius apollo TaxID=110799 RepID=A0A8S3XZJ3_PARAO|nr:unnamed protein product [Parnassius apollo]
MSPQVKGIHGASSLLLSESYIQDVQAPHMYRISRTTTDHIRRYTITPSGQCETFLTIKNVPRPRSLPLFGTKLDFFLAGRGTRLHEYIDARHKLHGSIFCEKLNGNTDLVFISDAALMKTLFLNREGKYPAHILPDPWVLYEKLYGFKRGLFFMDGEEWLNNRRIMNKHLLRENTESWLESPIKQTVDNFISKLKGRAANCGIVLEIESDLYKLSTDVIIKVLLGTNSSIFESKHYEELVAIFSNAVKKIFQTTTKLHGLPLNLCQRLNLKVWTDFKESVDISIFLAQKIVNEILVGRHETNGLIKKLSDENMDDETIRKIAADFIIAAGDTTAYTTLWTLLMLFENSEVLNELRRKDDLYVKCVIKESMRLYPVAPFLTRILPKDCFLGPYKFKQGKDNIKEKSLNTPIVASIYTSGRDEQNFSNANMFLPYRWDRNDPRKENLTNHVPSASLPFALGARSCIGKKIAITQLTEVIQQVSNNFEFKFNNSKNIRPITSQVLVPNKQIELCLTLRNYNEKE